MDLKADAWERAAEVPLTLAAMVFLAAFAVPIIWWPDTPASVVVVCEALVWITWVIFALDYLVRLLLSTNRRAFARRHWFDLATATTATTQDLALGRSDRGRIRPHRPDPATGLSQPPRTNPRNLENRPLAASAGQPSRPTRPVFKSGSDSPAGSPQTAS